MAQETPLMLYVAAALAGFIALLAVAIRVSMARYVVLGMLFLACLAVPRDYWGMAYQTWLLPLQSQRSALYLSAGVLLGVACLLHSDRRALAQVGGQSWVLIAAGIWMGLLWMVHEPFPQSAQVLPFALATLVPLAVIVPTLLQKRGDWDSLLRVFVLLNAAWVFAALVQYAINPDMVIMGAARRFNGVIGNPQHAAVILAICSVVVTWLLLYRPGRIQWVFLAGLLGINLILLGWTGSRTGALMFVLGTTAILYRRVGRAILLFPLAAFTVWAAYRATGILGIELGLERLLSTTDTRTHAWRELFIQGTQNLWVGVGLGERLWSENSFLTAFASFGIGMFALTLLLVAVVALHCLKLFQVSRVAEQWRAHIDLMLAFNFMFLVGAMFEGYIVSRVNFTVAAMMIFAGMGGKILYLYRTGELNDAAEEDTGELFLDQTEWQYDVEPAAG